LGRSPKVFFWRIFFCDNFTVMQIKIFTIPILGGEVLNDELNRFLRAKKVLQLESQLISQTKSGFWCFCIKYLDD